MYNNKLKLKIFMNNFSIPRAPFTKTGKSLESFCRKAIFDFKMLDDSDLKNGLAIALSGGKDSLTLLFLLKAILGFGLPKIPLTAIHVDGDFSCGANLQKKNLTRICQALEISFISIKSNLQQKNPDCYKCSRERRKLIFEAAKKRKIAKIAFGHHSDDQAQTLLLNLLQKGEFAAMLPKIKMIKFGITIIRPLIYAKEMEIKKFSEYYGFLRAVCNCPRGAVSKRKDVDRLIDTLSKFFPHARSNLALSALLYGSDKALKI